ncbi:MAG: zinc-ribbon domain-containing protein [Clostridia bacterium]|nr:zinc-ribbon domain-containing protein [Clostridia bacterium]
MKFCTHCGKELLDEAVICPGCGCAVSGKSAAAPKSNESLLDTLAQRLNTNAIIWLVIGVLQIIGGIFWNWFLLVVGVLNIISSMNDMKYSKTLHQNHSGIVEKFEPLTGPIITLIYNLVFGGVIGAVGSVYYLLAIRSFVLENRQQFAQMDTPDL